MRRLLLPTAAILLPFCLQAAALGQVRVATESRPQITVSGEAVIKVAPDQIQIRLGVETWDADVTVAKRKNNEIVRKAMEALKELQIAEKQVQTDDVSIQIREDRPDRKSVVRTYQARNQFVVTVGEARQVDRVVTRMLEVGVNQLLGVDFLSTEFKRHRELARKLALEAAREKAQGMAAVLDQSIGRPLQISEGAGAGVWSYGGWGRGGFSPMSQNVIQQQGEAGEGSETIALGRITIRATVQVTFELKE